MSSRKWQNSRYYQWFDKLKKELTKAALKEEEKTTIKEIREARLAVLLRGAVLVTFATLHKLFSTEFFLNDFAYLVFTLFSVTYIIEKLFNPYRLSFQQNRLYLSTFWLPIRSLCLIYFIVQFPFDMSAFGNIIPVLGPLFNLIPPLLLLLLWWLVFVVVLFNLLFNSIAYYGIKERFPERTFVFGRIREAFSITSDTGQRYQLKLRATPFLSLETKNLYYNFVQIEFGGKSHNIQVFERIHKFELIAYYKSHTCESLVEKFDFQPPLDKLFIKALIQSRVFTPTLQTHAASEKIPPIFHTYLQFDPKCKKKIILRKVLPAEEVKGFKEFCKAIRPIMFREGIKENLYNVILLELVTQLAVPFLPPKDRLTGLGEVEIRRNHIIGLDFPHLGRPVKVNEFMLTGDPALYPALEWSRTVKKLTHLPEEVGAFTQLEYLNLEENLLQELPDTIQNLQSLKNLKLSYNRFYTFPEEIFALLNLEQLDLSFNFIEDLPDKILSMKNLIWLKLQKNYLKTLPAGVLDHPSLCYLHIHRNLIFERDLLPQPIIDAFVRQANTGKCDVSLKLRPTFDSVFFKQSTRQLIDSLPPNEQEILVELNHGGFNLLSALDPEYHTITIEDNHIKKLYLSNFYLGKIPENICHLPHLELLSLINCGIKTFPDTFSWDNLRTLDLENNLIEKIPPAIDQLRNLEVLDLSKNRISELPQAAFRRMTHLTKLWMRHPDEVVHPDLITFIESLPESLNLVEFKFSFLFQVLLHKNRPYSIQNHERTDGDYIIWIAPDIYRLQNFFTMNQGIICEIEYEEDYPYLRIFTQDQEINFEKIYSAIQAFEKENKHHQPFED